MTLPAAHARTFVVEGAELAGSEAGAGRPVVFVHGSASDARTWDSAFRAVAERHRAIRYSRRFHYPNPPLRQAETYSHQRQLADLVQIVDELSAPMTLVGHSSGGVLALLAASRRPDRMRRLVLVEPAVFGRIVSDPPKLAELSRLFVSDPALATSLIRFATTCLLPARAAARRGRREEAMRLFGRGVFGRAAYRRLSRERMQQTERNFFEQELMATDLLPITADDVAAVDCPTLVVSGDDSPLFFRRLAQRLAAELPKARLVSLAGASHLVHEDAPDGFAEALLGFLDSEDED